MIFLVSLLVRVFCLAIIVYVQSEVLPFFVENVMVNIRCILSILWVTLSMQNLTTSGILRLSGYTNKHFNGRSYYSCVFCTWKHIIAFLLYPSFQFF